MIIELVSMAQAAGAHAAEAVAVTAASQGMTGAIGGAGAAIGVGLIGSKAVEALPVELIQFVNNEVKKVPSDLFTTSISEVCFYTDDIDSAYKHLVDNNVECLSEPQYFDFRAEHEDEEEWTRR